MENLNSSWKQNLQKANDINNPDKIDKNFWRQF